MSAPTQSRQQILNRIRANTSSVAAEHLESAYATLPRTYIRVGSLSAQARLALMIERLREYDAEVVECDPQDLPSTIAAQLQSSGKRILSLLPACPPPGLLSASTGELTAISPRPRSN